MKFLTNCIGFMAVLCAVDASWAARTAPANESRVSYTVPVTNGMAAARSRRLPTITSIGTTSTGTATTGNKSTMTANECVDAYTECIRGSDACGSDFEECTNNTLFYAKKPICNNTLLQCSSAAVNTLFGNSNITALANKDNNDEYIYPTAGSVLGQFIAASEISNRLDTGNCVKKYTSCLKKESVCGADFELCTDNTEFKKQKVFCESTLARCQADGVRELFGSDNRAATPAPDSRIGIMITEGANLAAVNAVSTCYKVVDQCFMSACEQNPFKCMVGSDKVSANIAEALDAQTSGTATSLNKSALISGVMAGDTVEKSQVLGYVKGACLDTIGANKYCYATFLGEGQMPKAADLLDEDNRSEIFNEAYNSRMNNPVMTSKIQQLADKFDKKAKDKCVETIKSCAMRSCGGGVGSMCYASVRANSGNSINSDRAYQEIKTGCESLVNTDANCQYAASKDSTYRYSDSTAFGILFPQYEDGFKDPLAVVGSLNATLAASYNDAAMDKFAKQCKNIANSCIISMCGADYKGCYRNRSDIMGTTYSSDLDIADSMNKVGGVLDFTIVIGLCMETVKNAKACEEHFGVQAAKKDANGGGVSRDGWADADSVRAGWADAVSGGYKQVKSGTDTVNTGLCSMDTTLAINQRDKCREKGAEMQACNSMDGDGCLYTVEEEVSVTEYQMRMEANTLFREVLVDAEKNAQLLYNQKITKEQNACREQNNGGVMGRNDMTGSTYQWVKLNSAKVPSYYSTRGLRANDFKPTNDLYGSFCRVRVMVQSDDPDIQEELRKGTDWSTAYFAVGDPITCGSWIPQTELEKISKTVAAKKTGLSEDGKLSAGQKWAVAASTIGAAGAGYGLTELLQRKTGLGGLMNTTAGVSKSSDVKKLETNLVSWEEFKNAGNVLCGSEPKKTVKGENNKYEDCYTLTSDGIVDGVVLKKPVNCSNSNGCNAVDSSFNVENHIKTVRDKLGYDADKPKVGTWLASSIVGTGGAVAAGIGVTQALKAKNNKELTAAQQEWLDQVGSHIVCYVGPDEAGTYGDSFTTSLE